MIRTDDRHQDETRLMERLDRIVGDTLIAAMIVIGLLFCLGAARAAEQPTEVRAVSPGTVYRDGPPSRVSAAEMPVRGIAVHGTRERGYSMNAATAAGPFDRLPAA
ncbi:hypothetical protein [Alsobacter sp. R-9]